MNNTATPSHTNHRHAFTLVELLVVIAIIGILVGLLLPAVQAARESGRRLQCQNNLKQLGLGALQHTQAHSHYPTGGWGYRWTGDPDRGFGKEQPCGWTYTVLPYIEQDNLFELGRGQSAANKRATANQLCRTPLAMFNCPSRRAAKLYPKPWDGTTVAYNANDNGTPNDVNRTDYAANEGSVPDGYITGPTTLALGDTTFAWRTMTSTGISFERSTVNPATVRDGKSNTILLGEKYLPANHYDTGMVGHDNESIFTGYNNDQFRTTNANYPPRRDRAGYDDGYAFGSTHPAGVNYVFCDGSVRPIGYEADAAMFQRLGSRDSGEVAPNF